MKARRVKPPNVETFTDILQAYGNAAAGHRTAHRPDDAMKLADEAVKLALEMVPVHRISHDSNSYAALLSILCETGRVQEALGYLDCIREGKEIEDRKGASTTP